MPLIMSDTTPPDVGMRAEPNGAEWAATSIMGRALQEGETRRPLREKATSRSMYGCRYA